MLPPPRFYNTFDDIPPIEEGKDQEADDTTLQVFRYPYQAYNQEQTDKSRLVNFERKNGLLLFIWPNERAVATASFKVVVPLELFHLWPFWYILKYFQFWIIISWNQLKEPLSVKVV